MGWREDAGAPAGELNAASTPLPQLWPRKPIQQPGPDPASMRWHWALPVSDMK